MDEHGAIFKEIVDELDTAVYVVDRDMKLIYWNKGAERITGFAGPEVLGRRGCKEVLAHVDQQGRSLCGARCPLAATLADGASRDEKSFFLHRDGRRVPARVRTSAFFHRDGTIRGAVVRTDETVSSRGAQQRLSELERLANFDLLTGLPNRRFTEVSLRQFVSEMARYRRTFGVVMMDVNGFKWVNDTYGHQEGDRVLQMVARTLARNSRPFDVVGRWGGDEFLVLVKHIDRLLLGRVTEKYGRVVAASNVEVAGKSLNVTVSRGAILAEPGDTPESLVARADQAMYLNKMTRFPFRVEAAG